MARDVRSTVGSDRVTQSVDVFLFFFFVNFYKKQNGKRGAHCSPFRVGARCLGDERSAQLSSERNKNKSETLIFVCEIYRLHVSHTETAIRQSLATRARQPVHLLNFLT